MGLELKSSFPERLKLALGEMTSTELAKKIGLSKQTISSYLTGVRNPKLPVVKSIAEALEVSEMWLMGYDVPMERDEIQPETENKKSEEKISLTEHEMLLIQAYRNQPTMQAAVDRILNVPANANHDALITDMANTINKVAEVSARNQIRRNLKK